MKTGGTFLYCKVVWLVFLYLTRSHYKNILSHFSCVLVQMFCLIKTHLHGSGRTQMFCVRAERHTNDEVPFYDPGTATFTLQDCSEEKDLIYSAEAMCQPLQVANKRRLYSLPSLSPGSSEISRVAEKKRFWRKRRGKKNLADQAD